MLRKEVKRRQNKRRHQKAIEDDDVEEIELEEIESIIDKPSDFHRVRLITTETALRSNRQFFIEGISEALMEDFLKEFRHHHEAIHRLPDSTGNSFPATG